MTSEASTTRRSDPADLLDALGLMVAIWSVLAAGGALAPVIGSRPALLASFGLACGVCLVDALARRGNTTRRADRLRRWALRRRDRHPDTVAVVAWRLLGTLGRAAALAALGWALAPGLIVAAAAVGSLLGVTPTPSRAPGPAALVACLVLAPAFEEHLYRGRLLPALSRHLGPRLALLASSALFALPHLRPAAIFGSALAGAVLGAVWLRTGRTLDTIAIHAGMNVAALAASGTLPLALPHPAFGLAAGIASWPLLRPIGPARGPIVTDPVRRRAAHVTRPLVRRPRARRP